MVASKSLAPIRRPWNSCKQLTQCAICGLITSAKAYRKVLELSPCNSIVSSYCRTYCSSRDLGINWRQWYCCRELFYVNAQLTYKSDFVASTYGAGWSCKGSWLFGESKKMYQNIKLKKCGFTVIHHLMHLTGKELLVFWCNQDSCCFLKLDKQHLGTGSISRGEGWMPAQKALMKTDLSTLEWLSVTLMNRLTLFPCCTISYDRLQGCTNIRLLSNRLICRKNAASWGFLS